LDRALIDTLAAAKADHQPVVVVTDLADGGKSLIENGVGIGEIAIDEEILAASAEAMRHDKTRTLDAADGRRLFLHVFNPPLRLFVIGAVHIAQSLAPISALMGYDVTVIDPRTSFATADRFPGVKLTHEWPDEALTDLKPDARSAIVTLTHDPKLDDPALHSALNSECFYIGCLGSQRTHALRVKRLQQAEFSNVQIDRIHGPVGLNIGAKSPPEIAISIMAEITSRLRRSAG